MLVCLFSTYTDNKSSTTQNIIDVIIMYTIGSGALNLYDPFHMYLSYD